MARKKEIRPRNVSGSRRDRFMSIKTIESFANKAYKRAQEENIKINFEEYRFRLASTKGQAEPSRTVGFYDENCSVDLLIEDMADMLAEHHIKVSA